MWWKIKIVFLIENNDILQWLWSHKIIFRYGKYFYSCTYSEFWSFKCKYVVSEKVLNLWLQQCPLLWMIGQGMLYIYSFFKIIWSIICHLLTLLTLTFIWDNWIYCTYMCGILLLFAKKDVSFQNRDLNLYIGCSFYTGRHVWWVNLSAARTLALKPKKIQSP